MFVERSDSSSSFNVLFVKNNYMWQWATNRKGLSFFGCGHGGDEVSGCSNIFSKVAIVRFVINQSRHDILLQGLYKIPLNANAWAIRVVIQQPNSSVFQFFCAVNNQDTFQDCPISFIPILGQTGHQRRTHSIAEAIASKCQQW